MIRVGSTGTEQISQSQKSCFQIYGSSLSLRSGTADVVKCVCKDVLCVRLQDVLQASTALSVLRCVAVRTGPTVTTSAVSVPAGRASSDRAVSSVSVHTSLHQTFSFTDVRISGDNPINCRQTIAVWSVHPAVRSEGVLKLCSLRRVSGGDVWLRLPAAVWVYEQRHLRLRDGNLLLQHRLQRHPLRPGWEMMALHGGRRTYLWLSDECLKLPLPAALDESWYRKMLEEHVHTVFKKKLQRLWWSHKSAGFIYITVGRSSLSHHSLFHIQCIIV